MSDLAERLSEGYEEGMSIYQQKVELTKGELDVEALTRSVRVEQVFLRNAVKFLNEVSSTNAEVNKVGIRIRPLLEHLQMIVSSQLKALQKSHIDDFQKLWGEEQKLQRKISGYVKTPKFGEAKPVVKLVGVLGMMLMLSGCVGVFSNSPSSLSSFSPEVASQVHRPSYLLGNEHVLPDEIIDNYLSFGARERWWSTAAFYIENEFGQDTKDYIKRSFMERGLSESLSASYADIFSGGNVLIFRASYAAGEDFPFVVMHERMHRNFAFLNHDQQRRMKAVADSMQQYVLSDKNRSCPGLVILGMRFSGHACEIIAQTGIERNAEEFFTYAAEGYWSEEAMQHFINEFPDAYQIYLGIVAKAREGLPLGN